MTRRKTARAVPAGSGNPHAADTGSSPDSQLSIQQIQRWAVLIAAGEDDFPNDLAAPDRERLAREVRALHRDRLLRLVARTVAQDIVARSAGTETTTHVETNF